MKNLKKTAWIIVTSCIVLIINASCEKENTLPDESNPFIGTWKQEISDEVYYKIRFNKNLTYNDEYHGIDYFENNSGRYSYSVEESTITFTLFEETWSEDFEFTNSTTLIMSGDVYNKEE